MKGGGGPYFLCCRFTAEAIAPRMKSCIDFPDCAAAAFTLFGARRETFEVECVSQRRGSHDKRGVVKHFLSRHSLTG